MIVGTQFGISRIAKDGSAEKVFPVHGNVDCDVRDLSIDGQGRLWAATVWGLLRFERAGPDLRSESPTLYTSQDQAESLRQSASSGWATPRTLDEHLLSVHTWMDGLGLRTRSGVVGHLAEGGAAHTLGIRIGDRILEIDGRSDDLNVRLSGQPGRESELLVLHVSGDTTRYSIDHTEIDGVYRNFELFSLFGRGKDGLWVNTSLGNILRFSPEYNA